jgi:hypothetical protein
VRAIRDAAVTGAGVREVGLQQDPAGLPGVQVQEAWQEEAQGVKDEKCREGWLSINEWIMFVRAIITY